MFILDFLFGRKDKEQEVEYLRPIDIKIEDNHIDIPVIEIKDYNAEKRTVLMMDDYPGMLSLLTDDLIEIDHNFKYRFNLLEATGNFAAFSVLDFLKNSLIPIDIALIDITLGGIVVKDGKVKEYDGVDVALRILKKNPKCKIRFITGHSINRKNPEIYKFIKKYEDATGQEIDGVVITKNSNRKEGLRNFFSGF